MNYRPRSGKNAFLEIEYLYMPYQFAGLSILMLEIDTENFSLMSQRLAILQNNL